TPSPCRIWKTLPHWTVSAPRSARSGKRADAGASRALDIARRVLAEAGEAPPAATRTNDGEASHD
ncbi:hypothetical protein QZN24_27980, partial [Burkholderia multivorans]|nr:hypothetical protein [Burkholderia multivorans]